MPINKPPNKVPIRLPTPPTMMAMKLGINSSSPIFGLSPIWPAARTPLKPAKRQPTAKLSVRKCPTLTPRVATVSQIEGAGANAQTDARIAQEGEQADHRHDDDG